MCKCNYSPRPLVVNLANQKPKPSETHSSTFPQDSECDSESEIELRSTHGTLVDTSSSTTPSPSLLGEGDLDSAEGHSQPIGGTLPLSDQGLPDSVSMEELKDQPLQILPPGILMTTLQV